MSLQDKGLVRGTAQFERRHSRWYEVLLLGGTFRLMAGLVVVVLLPAVVFWGPSFWRAPDNVQVATLWAVVPAFMLVVLTLQRVAPFSARGVLLHVGPVVMAVYLLAFALLFFSRSVYSRPVLLSSWALALVWCYVGHFAGWRYHRLKYAVLPDVASGQLRSTPRLEVRWLDAPDLRGVRYDAIVADLHAAHLAPEWQRFLTRCILAQIPVFHVEQVLERLSGRVRLDRLSENEAGALLPSPLYAVCKRIIDIVAVLLTLPITLPVMLAVALAIRFDSAGPVIFVQQRVGLGNGDFLIYKFRSMTADAEVGGARLADAGDGRITRVGHFIRRTRLDELPQLWNVLKGDMSLIGPRPEQRVFVDQFEAELPFYLYRHVVRPGITGWAQVMQGYADDVESTRIKMQHDLYYIKYFSFWLDLLIVLRTVRIVLTGWGAR